MAISTISQLQFLLYVHSLMLNKMAIETDSHLLFESTMASVCHG